jgi:hypothetical protein
MNGAAMSVEFAKGRRDNGGGGRDRDGRGIFYLSLTLISHGNFQDRYLHVNCIG